MERPESIAYDPDRNYCYVSNINGDPSKVDHNGYISLIGLDGKILNEKWLEGLDGPKGIVYKNNKVYFADIRKVIIADAQKAEILNTIPISGSTFLNDLVITEDNILYVSDTQAKKIFKINSDLTVSELPGDYVNANGLFLKSNFLYIGANNSLIKYDLSTGKQTTVIYDTGNIDGLYVFSDSEVLYSYAGVLRYFRNNKKTVLVNGLPDNGWFADYILLVLNDRILLMVPNLSQSVICYQIW